MFSRVKWKLIFFAISLLVLVPTASVWSAPGDTTSIIQQAAEQSLPIGNIVSSTLDTTFGGFGDALGISAFFTSIWESLQRLIHDLATLLAAGLLYVCMNPMLPVDTGHIPDGMDPTVVFIIRTANMVRDLATDLSLLLLLLAIWRYWTVGSWKGQPGSWMSAVGRFIFAIGLVLAWPIIFNFQIHVTNEMLLRSFFQTPADMDMLVTTMDQALQFWAVGFGGAALSALAPVFGAVTGSVMGGPVGTIVGGALGGIAGAVGIILFMIFGLVFITEVIYFLVLKAIQIALLTAQYVFAPLFLICFISPDTEHVGSAFIRSFIEVSLWSFVWLGLLKVLCIIVSAPGSGAKILLIIGVLQIMIQIPAFLGRAQISPVSEFVTAGAFTGMITQGISQAGNSVKNAAVNYAKRETSGKFASFGTPETTYQALDVNPLGRDQMDVLGKKMQASTSTELPPPKNGNSPPTASANFSGAHGGSDKKSNAADSAAGNATANDTKADKELKNSKRATENGAKSGPPTKRGQDATFGDAGGLNIDLANDGSGGNADEAGANGGANTGANADASTDASTGANSGPHTGSGKVLNQTDSEKNSAGGRGHKRTPLTQSSSRKKIEKKKIARSLADQSRSLNQSGEDMTSAQSVPLEEGLSEPILPVDGDAGSGAPNGDEDESPRNNDGAAPGFNGLDSDDSASTTKQKDKGVRRMQAPNYVNAWMRPFVQAINNGGVLIVKGTKNGVTMNPDDGTVIITHTPDATDDQIGQLMAIGATSYAQGRTPQGRDRARESARAKNLDGPQNLKEHLLNGILYANTGQQFNETKLGISRGRLGMQNELALGAQHYITMGDTGENNEVSRHLTSTFGEYTPERQANTMSQMLDEDSTESGANRATAMATQALDGHGEQINDLSRAVMAKSIVASQRIDQKPMMQGVVDYMEAVGAELGYAPGTYSNEIAQPLVNNLTTEEAYACQAIASQSGRAACQNLPMVRAVAGLGRKHEPASFREAYREMSALTNDLGGTSPRNVEIAAETLRGAQDAGLNLPKIANPTVEGLQAGIRLAEQGDYVPQTITANDMRVAQVIPNHVPLSRDNVDLVRQDPEFRNDPDHLPKHLGTLFRMAPEDQWNEKNSQHLAELNRHHQMTPINEQTMRTLTHMTPNPHNVADLEPVSLNAARAIMSIERRPPDPKLLHEVVSKAEAYAQSHTGPVPIGQVKGWIDDYKAKYPEPPVQDFGQPNRPLVTFGN